MATRFIRNSGFGVIAGVSSTLGNFLASVLVARLLGVNDTGAVAFWVWLVNTTVTVSAMGLPFTLGRYIPELIATGREDQAKQLTAFLLRPFAIATAAVAAIYLAIAAFLYVSQMTPGAVSRAGFLGSDPVLYVILGLCCTAQSLADFARGYLRGMQQFARIARLTTLSTAGQIAVIAVGALAFGRLGALSGYLAASVLPVLLVRFPVTGGDDLDGRLKSRVMRYSRYKWAAEVMTSFVWSRIEVFFLQIWWGPEAVAYFTVGLTLANLAIQGPLMLTWGLLPRFSEQFGRNELEALRAGYATGTRILALMVLPACFGLAAILPELVPLLFGRAFEQAVPIAAVLVCSASIAASAAVGSNLLWAMDRSDVDFYTGTVGAAISLIGGMTVIAMFGPMGAAVSRAVTQTAVVGLSFWFLSRRSKFPAPTGDLLRLLVAALICAASARLTLFFVAGAKGVMAAVVVGIAVYAAALRLVRPLPAHDVDKLRSLIAMIPRPMNRVADALLLLLVPARSGSC